MARTLAAQSVATAVWRLYFSNTKRCYTKTSNLSAEGKVRPKKGVYVIVPATGFRHLQKSEEKSKAGWQQRSALSCPAWDPDSKVNREGGNQKYYISDCRRYREALAASVAFAVQAPADPVTGCDFPLALAK